MPALKAWVAKLDTEDADYDHQMLEALWVYQSLDVVNETLVLHLLKSENHQARAAATRTLYYWNKIDNALTILKDAVVDKHPQVRLEAVIALQKQPTAEAAKAALSVLEYPMDEFLDFALWQTIQTLEPHWMAELNANPDFLGDSRKTAFALKSVNEPQAIDLLIKLYSQGDVPEEYVDDVLTSIATHGTPEDLNILFDLAADNTSIPGSSPAKHLAALEEAASQREQQPDRNLERLTSFIEGPDEAASLSAVRLIGYWDMTEFQDRLVTLAKNGNDSMKKAALGALSSLDNDKSRTLLVNLSSAEFPPELRLMATTELVSLDVAKAADQVVDIVSNLPSAEDASELFIAFLTQEGGTAALAKVLTEQKIPTEVAKVGRQSLQRHQPRNQDEAVKLLTQALEASGGTLPPERMPQQLSDQEINNLELAIKSTAAPDIGESIFRKKTLNCMTCHAIGGAGGQIGPDLSSLGTSAPTADIIRSLIEPNESIKEGYELQRVVKKDGSVVMGYLTRKTASEVVLRNVAGEEVVIPASQIDVHENVPGSLMPAGLTASLEREEFINLVGFLSKSANQESFRVPTAQYVRRWGVLTDNKEVVKNIRENGLQYAAGEETKNYQQPSYSKVSGELPLAELPLIELKSDQHYRFVTFEIEVLNAGNVKLGFNASKGITAWVDQNPVSLSEQGIVTDLPKGIHRFTLAINQEEHEAESLSIQLQDAENSTAQTRLIMGK